MVDGGADATATVDASADAPPDDAGPSVTSTLAATGTIELAPSLMLAYFRYDDTVVRTSAEPGCVLFVRTAYKPFANAGNLIVGGDFVGKDGGLATPGSYSTENAMGNAYEVFLSPEVFFPTAPAMRLQIEKADYEAFPAIALTTLRTPTTTPLQVKTPSVPDAGPLVLSAAKGLSISWSVPASEDAGSLPPARVSVSLKGLATASLEADLRCGFPVASGGAVLPPSLLREIQRRLQPGSVGPAITGGFLSIGFGDQREIRSGDATYVVQVTRSESSSFVDVEATLEN